MAQNWILTIIFQSYCFGDCLDVLCVTEELKEIQHLFTTWCEAEHVLIQFGVTFLTLILSLHNKEK